MARTSANAQLEAPRTGKFGPLAKKGLPSDVPASQQPNKHLKTGEDWIVIPVK